jgi:hypothetical protein
MKAEICAIAYILGSILKKIAKKSRIPEFQTIFLY